MTSNFFAREGIEKNGMARVALSLVLQRYLLHSARSATNSAAKIGLTMIVRLSPSLPAAPKMSSRVPRFVKPAGEECQQLPKHRLVGIILPGKVRAVAEDAFHPQGVQLGLEGLAKAGVILASNSLGSRRVIPESGNNQEHAMIALTPEQRLTVESKFRDLANQWAELTACRSNMSALRRHPLFDEIVALGEPAVPLILRELERKPSVSWFGLLVTMTDENSLGTENGDIPRIDRSKSSQQEQISIRLEK